MNEITLNYDFNGAPVRVVGTWDEPWFIAADVCETLDLETHVAVRRLDDDEKGRYTVPTPGGNQEMVIISESGLYSLILTSRKEKAKRFKRWVTHEVLPSIRKTGAYIHDFELFLTHPIYKDLEAHALEQVTNTMSQMIRLKLIPYLQAKHTSIDPQKLDTLLSDMKRFMFTYFPDPDGNLQYVPKSRRKAKPSRFVIQGDTAAQAAESYRMTHKHITNPLLTLEEYMAKVCDRPRPGIRPVGAGHSVH